MDKFKVMRYIAVETIVEAEDADDAIAREEKMVIDGKLECKDAIDFSWWVSDALGVTVLDMDDNVLTEDW